MVPASALAGDESSRLAHVVVLMLENRSFDHVLGFLDHPRPEAFDGLRPGRFHNPDGTGRPVPVSADGVAFGVDPDHSHQGALDQLAAASDVAANGGFVRSYEGVAGAGNGGVVMRMLDPAVHCRALGTLAREFAVCTRWFCSVPGETWPNRNFVHAASSGGTVNIEGGLYYDRTILEVLARQKGRTWRVYYDGTPQVWCYPRLWKPTTFLDFLLRRRARIGNWFESSQFAEHARRDDLATYNFIEPAHNGFYSPDGAPRQTNSQHPHNNLCDDRDFRAGEALIASVYEALRANPEVFKKTLLVITYDEHGGLYDHEKPPASCAPGVRSWRGITRRLGAWLRARADRSAGRKRSRPFDFSHLGVRVPAVLVSPWIEPGTIIDDPLEHSSIPRTLRELFAPDARPLTDRDRAANAFHHVVTSSPLARPRPGPGQPNPDGLPPVPDLSEEAGPGGIEAPVADAAASAPPTGDLDRELAALGRIVARRLRRHPTTVLARRRATKLGEADALAAPTGEVFPADQDLTLFRAAAKTARRRPVTRQPR